VPTPSPRGSSPRSATRPTVLILSQVYVPDPASVGQHMHDAARELARRGFRVVVYAAARGYDDPSQRYPRRETLDGVEIRRIPFASFGKGSLRARLLGGVSFLIQATLRGLVTRRSTGHLAGVLVSTSPPMASAAGVVLTRLRRVPLAFWVMDVNPDQAVVTGAISRRSLPARLLEASNRAAARRSAVVIFLDRYMARRLRERWHTGDAAAILPPWSHDSHLEPIPHAENPFRAERGWGPDTMVLMYSGNISPVHPVMPILHAARRLRDEPRLRFVFIGGGAGRAQVEETVRSMGLDNVELLPYQPLERLRFSLSAADVHLVTMGAAMVGVVHPCKVYGALRVARPVLFVGPDDSHVGEILRTSRAGWQVNPADVDALEARIRSALALDAAARGRIGVAAATAAEEFTEKRLCKRFGDLLEGAFRDDSIAPRAQKP